MKKFLLFLALVLTGCQSLSGKTDLSEIFQGEMVTPKYSQQQFESRELKTELAFQQKVKVAMLLPFSGKNSDLGWSLFNAASMSLFENDINRNIELVLIDAKETAEDVKKAFKEIVDSNIKIVIGPVFSNSLELIENDAKQNGITVISLSNNQKLMDKTNDNGGIFLAGMMPEAQIDRIVGYEIEKNKHSFSIIAPSSQYGNTIVSLFKKIVKSRDGDFVTSEFYRPSDDDKDFQRIADHVVNAFVVSSKGSKKDVINESDRTYSQVILIPESGKVLSRIVEAIKEQNKDERDFQIIGTSQWDDNSTLSDYNLIGSLFAAPENKKFRKFEKNYYRLYEKFPPRISSITYDLVAAISQLVDLKENKTPTINDFLNPENPPINGFTGIDGDFRFLPNGLIQRNLAVLSVGNGRFDTIEEPVEGFLKF
jgi:ABC-type branched-subunit amino acid transport system substrate-binding protein